MSDYVVGLLAIARYCDIHLYMYRCIYIFYYLI